RAGRAGFFTTTNLANPGSTKMPLFLSSRCPTVTSVSTTIFTCLRVTSSPIESVTAWRIALFERGLFFFAALAMFENLLQTATPLRPQWPSGQENLAVGPEKRRILRFLTLQDAQFGPPVRKMRRPS